MTDLSDLGIVIGTPWCTRCSSTTRTMRPCLADTFLDCNEKRQSYVDGIRGFIRVLLRSINDTQVIPTHIFVRPEDDRPDPLVDASKHVTLMNVVEIRDLETLSYRILHLVEDAAFPPQTTKEE
jgi:hypothetical protein